MSIIIYWTNSDQILINYWQQLENGKCDIGCDIIFYGHQFLLIVLVLFQGAGGR